MLGKLSRKKDMNNGLSLRALLLILFALLTAAIMGVIWMTNLLYPQYYKVDVKAKTKEFYSLFYNRKLTDAEVNEILATSLRK